MLIKNDGPPIPVDVREIFEDALLDFVGDQFAKFCPIIWNKDATVVDQELSPIGGLPAGSRNDGGEGRSGFLRGELNRGGGGGRHLQRLLEPILRPPRGEARSRLLLQTITLLDANVVVDAIYDASACPFKSPEELANVIETYINNNKEAFLERLNAAYN